MRRAQKGKDVAVNTATARQSTTPIVRGAVKKSKADSATASAPSRSTRSGLRSRPDTQPTQHFEDNPESILRKAQKSRKRGATTQAQDRPKSPIHNRPNDPIPSIETAPAEEYDQLQGVALEDSFDKGTSSSLQDTDPEQITYRKWGYLPPLDEEVVALIDAIIAAPETAKDYTRTSPENPLFPDGLAFRNVFMEESAMPDPYAHNIKPLEENTSAQETTEERKLHDQLWNCDQAKCREGSNEALFQRTLMMSVIARHHLIYNTDSNGSCYLDFSVEEVWTCPPMPTRAYKKPKQFLTQPKPDLAVCFSRTAIIPDELFNDMPSATRHLACYENTSELGRRRAFHFFTVEAKKANISPDDTVGKRQSLNNASQSLHNMFEFFRDAGPEHEKKFYSDVRFFSVVASTGGIVIRIHRAIKDPADGSGQGLIMPDKPEYPLRFEYREFCSIPKERFGRKPVFETIESILVGYGVNKLRLLLLEAAKAIMVKLKQDDLGMYLREDINFYRYGQNIVQPHSRKLTSESRAPSETTNFSIDMLRTETVTPMPHQSQISTLALNSSGKRIRGESFDAEQPRVSRMRKK